MPVYEFRCAGCGATEELVLPRGETGPRPCPNCGDQLRRRYSRVAVRYSAWGFNSTDRLVNRPGRNDFRTVREKAEQISDE